MCDRESLHADATNSSQLLFDSDNSSETTDESLTTLETTRPCTYQQMQNQPQNYTQYQAHYHSHKYTPPVETNLQHHPTSNESRSAHVSTPTDTPSPTPTPLQGTVTTHDVAPPSNIHEIGRIMEGWIIKRGSRFKTWRRRYAYLHPDRIVYFTEKPTTDASPRGEWNIAQIHAVVVGQYEGHIGGHCFKITTGVASASSNQEQPSNQGISTSHSKDTEEIYPQDAKSSAQSPTKNQGSGRNVPNSLTHGKFFSEPILQTTLDTPNLTEMSEFYFSPEKNRAAWFRILLYLSTLQSSETRLPSTILVRGLERISSDDPYWPYDLHQEESDDRLSSSGSNSPFWPSPNLPQHSVARSSASLTSFFSSVSSSKTADDTQTNLIYPSQPQAMASTSSAPSYPITPTRTKAAVSFMGSHTNDPVAPLDQNPLADAVRFRTPMNVPAWSSRASRPSFGFARIRSISNESRHSMSSVHNSSFRRSPNNLIIPSIYPDIMALGDPSDYCFGHMSGFTWFPVKRNTRASPWEPYPAALTPQHGFESQYLHLSSTQIRWCQLIDESDLRTTQEDGSTRWRAPSSLAQFDTDSFALLEVSVWSNGSMQSFVGRSLDETHHVSHYILVPKADSIAWMAAFVFHSNRDWNWEFQELREKLYEQQTNSSSLKEIQQTLRSLQSLVSQFEIKCAQISVRYLQQNISWNLNYCPPIRHPLGIGTIHRQNGILFKVSRPDSSKYPDEMTAKLHLANEFRANAVLEHHMRSTWRHESVLETQGDLQYQSKVGIFCPLTLTIDQSGFRFLFTADSGVFDEKSEVVYNSSVSDGNLSSQDIAIHRLRFLFQNNNTLGSLSSGRWLFGGTGLKLIRSRDERFYLLEPQNILPRIDIVILNHNFGDSVFHPENSDFILFRPEFIKLFPESLFSPNNPETGASSRDSETHIITTATQRATYYLLNEHMIRFLRLLPQEPQWYISVYMHAFGINLRFMGRLLQMIMSIPSLSSSIWPKMLVCEMFCRSMKEEGRRILREGSKLPEVEQRMACFSFLSSILGQEHSSRWLSRIRIKFPFCPELYKVSDQEINTNLDVNFVFPYLTTKLGIKLRKEAIDSHLFESPEDIHLIGRRVKWTSFPWTEKIDLVLANLQQGFGNYSFEHDGMRQEMLKGVCNYVEKIMSWGIISPKLMVDLGVCRLKLKEPKLAKASFTDALIASPMDPVAMMHLMEIYASTNSTLSLIYGMGSMISIDKSDEVVFQRTTMKMRKILGAPLFLTLVSSTFANLSKDQDHSADLVFELSQLKDCFSDMLLFPFTEPYPPWFLRQLRFYEKYLIAVADSRYVLPTLVQMASQSPYAVMVLGAIFRALNYLAPLECKYDTIHQRMMNVILQNKDAGCFALRCAYSRGPYEDDQVLSSYTTQLIFRYYSLYVAAFYLDNKEFLTVEQSRFCRVYAHTILHSPSIYHTEAMLLGLWNSAKHGGLELILAQQPDMINVLTTLIFQSKISICVLSWLSLEQIASDPLALNFFVQDNTNISYICRRYARFIIQELELLPITIRKSSWGTELVVATMQSKAVRLISFLVNLTASISNTDSKASTLYERLQQLLQEIELLHSLLCIMAMHNEDSIFHYGAQLFSNMLRWPGFRPSLDFTLIDDIVQKCAIRKHPAVDFFADLRSRFSQRPKKNILDTL
eukprot:TRINITY_DN4519_c2_g1_i1.p1 TRINITY_DN4519_c2_g1~~TRINITY_DN4519_c2_g1_i1.p1  ORF type:complete len:1669 (+),score=264.80 TRINITY_DN4519_c2_g1_i1:16-5022(+)